MWRCTEISELERGKKVEMDKKIYLMLPLFFLFFYYGLLFMHTKPGIKISHLNLIYMQGTNKNIFVSGHN